MYSQRHLRRSYFKLISWICQPPEASSTTKFRRDVTFKTLGFLFFCHPQLDMQLFPSPEQLREFFMPFPSSNREYQFSPDLYFGYFLVAVLAFSCPENSLGWEIPKMPGTGYWKQNKINSSREKNMFSAFCFWGEVSQLEAWPLVDFVLKAMKKETWYWGFYKACKPHYLKCRALPETKWGFFGNACWKWNIKKLSLDVLG